MPRLPKRCSHAERSPKGLQKGAAHWPSSHDTRLGAPELLLQDRDVPFRLGGQRPGGAVARERHRRGGLPQRLGLLGHLLRQPLDLAGLLAHHVGLVPSSVRIPSSQLKGWRDITSILHHITRIIGPQLVI